MHTMVDDPLLRGLMITAIGVGLLAWMAIDSARRAYQRHEQAMRAGEVTELIECNLCGRMSVICHDRSESVVTCNHCDHVNTFITV